MAKVTPWDGFEGVRPHRSQRGLAKPTRWELYSGVLTDSTGKQHPAKKKVVRAGTPRQASEIRKRWIADLHMALARGGQDPTPQAHPVEVSPLREVPKQRAKKTLTIKDYIEEHFLPWVQEEQAPLTYKHKAKNLRYYVIPLVGKAPIEEAASQETLKKIRSYLATSGPKKVNSKNTILMNYSSMLSHAASPEKAPGGVPLLVRPRIPIFKERALQQGEQRVHQSGYILGSERHKRLTDEQVHLLFQECRRAIDPDFAYALVGLGLFVGCRKGEIAAVKFSDIDWDENRINIHSHVSQIEDAHVPWVKNAVPGFVPLEASLRACLERLYIKAGRRDGYVLKGSYGKGHLSGWQVYTKYNKLAKKAWGVKRDTSVHALRHTFCSRLADKGTRVEIIQTLARHKSIATSFGYITPDEREIEAAGEALSFAPKLEIIKGGRTASR